MTAQLIHNIEIIDPFLISIYAPNLGIRGPIPAFSTPEAIVEHIFHDDEMPVVTKNSDSLGAMKAHDERANS